MDGWRSILLFAVLAAGLVTESRPAAGQDRQLSGPYLGQRPPGTTPEVFAPGIVSTKEDEYGFEVSADGAGMVFVRGAAIMLITRRADGTWNGPAVAPFSGRYVDGEPCFSPDGRRIYFCSRRPHPRARLASNVWSVDKVGSAWGVPAIVELPSPRIIHAPSVAASGSIYEDGVVRFKVRDGKYQPAEALRPPGPGIWPFIAPDESYILFALRRPGQWHFDLLVRRQRDDGTWSIAQPLGKEVNSGAMQGNPFVTADGRYLFFTRRSDIYWVRAEVIPGHATTAKHP